MPAINVILPVFNGEKYIKEAVGSILSQSFKDFSLNVIDDGSTDHTPAILSAFKDERLKVTTNAVNKGLIYSLNKGLEDTSDCKYIARMDADDISLPNRLEVEYGFMETYKKVDLLGTAMTEFEDNSTKKRIIYRPQSHQKIASTFVFYNPISHPTIMVRAAAIGNRRFSFDFPKYEDYHLWIELFGDVEMCNINDALVRYRRHKSNVTNTYSDNRLQDHQYNQKLIRLFASKTNMDLVNEEVNLISVISSKVRYEINAGFSVDEMREVLESVTSKLNAVFDRSHFRFLFYERMILYLLNSKRYADITRVVASMGLSNSRKLLGAVISGKR